MIKSMHDGLIGERSLRGTDCLSESSNRRPVLDCTELLQ